MVPATRLRPGMRLYIPFFWVTLAPPPPPPPVPPSGLLEEEESVEEANGYVYVYPCQAIVDALNEEDDDDDDDDELVSSPCLRGTASERR